MKNSFFKFVAITLTVSMAFVTSCKKDDDPTLSVDPNVTAIVFSANGATATANGAEISKAFTVTTNQSDWDVVVTPAGSWLSAQKSGKSFTLSATANTTVGVAPAPATVTITAGGAKAVTISATQLFNDPKPVTGINVSVTSLKLAIGDSELVMATLQPADHSEQGATLLWATSDPDVATVSGGMITAVGAGFAVITVSLQSNPAVKAEISIVIGTNVYLSQFEIKTIGGEEYLFGQVFFTKGAPVFINGIEESKIANAYNRDFFTYNSETGELIFIEETGTWDVFYSEILNFFWIFEKWATEYADRHDVIFISGAGICSALEWTGGGGWRITPADFGYAKLKGDGKYRVHAWLVPGFSLALRGGYAQNWTPLRINQLTGDWEGMNLLIDAGYTYNTHFQGNGSPTLQAGYFIITVIPDAETDPQTYTLNFERLN